MKTYSDDMHVNAGSGEDIPILELAQLVTQVVGFEGTIVTDASKPDGTPRKLIDRSVLAGMGWRPRIGLLEGAKSAYQAFLAGEGRSA